MSHCESDRTKPASPSTRRGGLLSLCTTAGTLFVTELVSAQATFVEEASRRGINYVVSQGAFGGAGQFGCGVCIADLDGDGDDDIVCLGASTERLGFFRNDGTGAFTDVSASTGLGQLTKASGIAAADYDADGDLDLALTRWVLPPALLRNDGAMQFTNVASAAGIAVTGAGAGVSWADYDGDGWVDLSVANRTGTMFNNTRNRLWRNNGNGTFTEKAAALGIDNGGWPAFTASWCDLDADGDMDLYVGNDKGVASPFWNRLYRNRGDGTFFEDLAAGADMQADSMGVGFGDLDGDGLPEIFVANIAVGNHLLRSFNGGVHYYDVASNAGVRAHQSCWGGEFLDLYNDGRTDLFFTSNSSDNFLMLQGAAWPLLDVTKFSGLSNTNPSFCSAQGDLDSDGGVDLLVQDHLQPVKLYMNRTPAAFAGSWVHLRAKGRGANTHGIGTRVVVSTGGRLQWREVAAGTGYKSQSSYRLHIGCGTDTSVAQAVVTFPKAGLLKRATRVLTGLPVNREWPLWPPEALGDANGDGVRSDADRIDLVKCLGQALVPAIARMDIDGDSDVDAADLEAFDRVQCDLDGDGLVDAADLAMLLAAWDTPGVDFNDDGTTDESDAHRMLERWTGG